MVVLCGYFAKKGGSGSSDEDSALFDAKKLWIIRNLWCVRTGKVERGQFLEGSLALFRKSNPIQKATESTFTFQKVH